MDPHFPAPSSPAGFRRPPLSLPARAWSAPAESAGRDTRAGHRPLVVRIAAMGDAVLLVPLLKALHRRYGSPCDVVSAGPWVRPLLAHLPEVADIVLLESRRTPYLLDRSQRQLVRWLRARPPGPVYACQADAKTHWLLRRGGVADAWLCSLRDIPPLGAREHQLDLQRRLVALTPRALGGRAAPVDRSLDHAMPVPPAALEDARRWLAALGLADRELVLVQAGNKRTMRRGSRVRRSNVKYWPEASWIELVGSIRRHRPGAAVLLCGSPEEFELNELIRTGCADNRVINIARELPIPRLMALQRFAHSMISIDTGPAHLASAVGCPLVVLFARPDAWRYFTRSTSAPVEIITPPDSPAALAAPHPLVHVSPRTVGERWLALCAALPARRTPPPAEGESPQAPRTSHETPPV